MATMNPFDLLGDDAEDPSQLIAAQPQKIAAATKKELGQGKPVAAAAQQNKPAKLPSKPLPPAQAVRETKTEAVRGGGRGGGRGFGRGRGGGGRGYDRDSVFNKNSYNTGVPGAPEDGEAVKSSERRGYGGPHGPYRGGFGNGEAGDEERTRRPFERRSGTGRGNEFKRGGSGQSNWGTPIDELSQVTEEVTNEKRPGDVKRLVEEVKTDLNKETPANESEEKEPEDKEMTLEEYEKILEEKRKALLARKTEERKVDVKVFESMQQLSNKKGNDDIFIKLGSEKDKRKEAEKDEKVKKSVSINEFLKPAVGERYQGQGGRGRGRGSRGFSARDGTSNVQAPAIEDEWQFPTLGGK